LVRRLHAATASVTVHLGSVDPGAVNSGAVNSGAVNSGAANSSDVATFDVTRAIPFSPLVILMLMSKPYHQVWFEYTAEYRCKQLSLYYCTSSYNALQMTSQLSLDSVKTLPVLCTVRPTFQIHLQDEVVK
jgi:hypothetical protein